MDSGDFGGSSSSTCVLASSLSSEMSSLDGDGLSDASDASDARISWSKRRASLLFRDSSFVYESIIVQYAGGEVWCACVQGGGVEMKSEYKSKSHQRKKNDTAETKFPKPRGRFGPTLALALRRRLLYLDLSWESFSLRFAND